MPPRRNVKRRENLQKLRNKGQRNNVLDVKVQYGFFENKQDMQPRSDACLGTPIPINSEETQESKEGLQTALSCNMSEESKDGMQTSNIKKVNEESEEGQQTVIDCEDKFKEGILESDIKVEQNISSDAFPNEQAEGDKQNNENQTSKNNENEDESIDLPYKVKVSHLPANYVLGEFLKHLNTTFRVKVEKIISPGKNNSWLIIQMGSKQEQENLVRSLHNHIWKKKALRAIAYYAPNTQKRKAEEELTDDGKKLRVEEIPELTLEEEILSESLPLHNLPYKKQNEITMVDVEILSHKLHAFMCVRNPALAGWAEAMCEKNNNSIFKIEPLRPSPVLAGYRNKCKFRIGKNTDGEITVGFCLNDNENKILGVQPGDKLIHLPDSMKYAAKKFEDFIRASGKEPYKKKQKSGFWDHIIIRVTPEGSLMLVIVMYHNHLSDENINDIKGQVKEYFENGEGKDCNLYSLYFQVMCDKAPVLPSEKLELLLGESHFLENICGLKFYVGPFSILNVNSSSSENIYKSIAELAEPTPETTVLDLCSGTGGIAFTIADKCKNVIAIESHADHIKDALKTKELNNITNVEFINGKVEDELSEVFKKLGDVPIIPIIDPPRQGLVQKAISQLRANKNIKKLVYVCSNSKMGAKNFLDMCASADKKEGTFGNPLNVVFAGLPFLPVRTIPVDVAPYTVNNTIIILFERIDPSTFPPPKNPPPSPIKRPLVEKNDKRRRRHFTRKTNKNRSGNRGHGSNKPRMPGNANKMGGGYGGQSVFSSNQFSFPFMTQMEPTLSLVAKYERRIAELEQRDLAFKAGLSMGLQVLNSRGPGPNEGNNFGNNFDSGIGGGTCSNGNNNFWGFGRNQFPRDNRNIWQRGGGGGGGGGNGGRNFGNLGSSFGGGRNFGNLGTSFGGGNNFGGGFNGAAFNFNNTGGNTEELGIGDSDFSNFGGMVGNNFNTGFGGNNLGGSGSTGGGFYNYRGKRRRR